MFGVRGVAVVVLRHYIYKVAAGKLTLSWINKHDLPFTGDTRNPEWQVYNPKYCLLRLPEF